MKLLSIVMMVSFCFPALANDRGLLISAIEVSGTHETSEERHWIEVDGCVMTTYRWKKPAPEKDWVLWSSFQFSMVEADFLLSELTPNQPFGYGVGDQGTPESGVATVGFKMKEGTTALQKFSKLRNVKIETFKSLESDLSTHSHRRVDHFFYDHKGIGVFGKAHLFTSAYNKYVDTYC